MNSFKDQSGSLVLINPNITPRPINYWSVPRWWGAQKRTIYAHCARVDDTANDRTIYIASATSFPQILIEEDEGNYTFDSDRKRSHVDRICIVSNTVTGVLDYRCPLRRRAITQIGLGAFLDSRLVTEAGTSLTTEAGEYIILTDGSLDSHLMNEAGDILTTEAGELIEL